MGCAAIFWDYRKFTNLCSKKAAALHLSIDKLLLQEQT